MICGKRGHLTMKTNLKLKLPQQKIADFCRRYHIRKLAVFGSALRGDFRPDSDLDVLVEFEPGHTPGLIGLAGMEIELSALVGGRKVDMNTPLCLSRFFRDEVLAEAEPVYVAG
jgi:predicted nucleotidyltransferase